MDLESNKGGFKNELTKRIKISKARASKKIALAFLIEVKEGEWLQWTARFQSAAEVNCVQVSSSPVGELSLLLKLMISHWRQSNLLLYPVDIFPRSSSLLLSISLLLFVSPHLLFINYTYMVTYIIYFCSLNPKPSGALFVFILFFFSSTLFPLLLLNSMIHIYIFYVWWQQFPTKSNWSKLKRMASSGCGNIIKENLDKFKWLLTFYWLERSQIFSQ